MSVLTAPLAEFAIIQPGGFRLLALLDQACRDLDVNLVITCGTEGHAPDDPHTRGEAYDVRVRDLPTPTIVLLVQYLRRQFGSLFTALLETPVPFTDEALVALQYVNPSATAAHLHVQMRKNTTFPLPDVPAVPV